MEPGEAAAFRLLLASQCSSSPPLSSPFPRNSNAATTTSNLICRPRRNAHWDREPREQELFQSQCDPMIQAYFQESISAIQRTYDIPSFGRWMQWCEKEESDWEWSQLSREIWVCFAFTFFCCAWLKLYLYNGSDTTTWKLSSSCIFEN
jgi:hypothetical protein